MKSYPSIQSVFVRDPETHRLYTGEIRMPETDCIARWSMTEKVDGTNIRVTITLGGIEIKGRTDKAQTSPAIIEAVSAHFDHAVLVDYFTQYRGRGPLPETWSVTFYGEAYGPKVAKKGPEYSDIIRFRVFDLMLGDFWWVSDMELRNVCSTLNIPTVPWLGFHHGFNFKNIDATYPYPRTREELKSIVPFSRVALEDRGVEDVEAEGIVARPEEVLLDIHGNRVMWKLTFREFK